MSEQSTYTTVIAVLDWKSVLEVLKTSNSRVYLLYSDYLTETKRDDIASSYKKSIRAWLVRYIDDTLFNLIEYAIENTHLAEHIIESAAAGYYVNGNYCASCYASISKDLNPEFVHKPMIEPHECLIFCDACGKLIPLPLEDEVMQDITLFANYCIGKKYFEGEHGHKELHDEDEYMFYNYGFDKVHYLDIIKTYLPELKEYIKEEK